MKLGMLMAVFSAALAAHLALAADERTTRVGIPATIENLILPGTELEIKPLDDRRAKVVARITNAQKHGTAHRYDLTYYALEAGTFDLRDLLQRKDGSQLGELPPIIVNVESSMPAGQILPSDPTPQRVPFLGGYSWALWIAGAIWLAVFLAILLVGRQKPLMAEIVTDGGPTLADRLRPLIERGLAGQLSLEERAELERSLIAFWTRRLKLESLRPADRFARLRSDADAGPLLRQLESWLHEPGPRSDPNMAELLRPYRNLPADALDDAEVSVR